MTVTDVKPKRVLHVLGTLNMGGAESRIMDIYRHIDRESLQFDFLVHTPADGLPEGAFPDSETLMESRRPQFFDEEVQRLGGRIYSLPRFNGMNLSVYRKAAERFFREHHDYICVEGHMTSTASVYLPIAKKAGVPVTIAHARSAGIDRGIKGLATRILRAPLPHRADILTACSGLAGEAVYGKRVMASGKVKRIPNAIDLPKYAFDPGKRVTIRAKYGLPENVTVIGHVGRFDAVKNQGFLIDCLAAAAKGKTALLFIGSGALEEEIRRKAADAGLADRVCFAGRMGPDETAAMYSAMDVFALPSTFEGLPGVAVEAQAAGLPCLISDHVTDEICLTEDVELLPIGEGNSRRWAKAFDAVAAERMRHTDAENFAARRRATEENAAMLTKKGYNVGKSAEELERWYLNLGKQ